MFGGFDGDTLLHKKPLVKLRVAAGYAIDCQLPPKPRNNNNRQYHHGFRASRSGAARRYRVFGSSQTSPEATAKMTSTYHENQRARSRGKQNKQAEAFSWMV
jgi:hypothetical protein